MTHTLTTEWLKERLKNPRTGTEFELISEVLANREAQPAGFYTTVSGRKGVIWHNGAPEDDTAIYTSPPAPAHAVAWEMRYWNSGYNCWHEWERITAEQHAEMSVQHATDNDYEFRVLYAVPAAPEASHDNS